MSMLDFSSCSETSIITIKFLERSVRSRASPHLISFTMATLIPRMPSLNVAAGPGNVCQVDLTVLFAGCGSSDLQLAQPHSVDVHPSTICVTPTIPSPTPDIPLPPLPSSSHAKDPLSLLSSYSSLIQWAAPTTFVQSVLPESSCTDPYPAMPTGGGWPGHGWGGPPPFLPPPPDSGAAETVTVTRNRIEPPSPENTFAQEAPVRGGGIGGGGFGGGGFGGGGFGGFGGGGISPSASPVVTPSTATTQGTPLPQYSVASTTTPRTFPLSSDVVVPATATTQDPPPTAGTPVLSASGTEASPLLAVSVDLLGLNIDLDLYLDLAGLFNGVGNLLSGLLGGGPSPTTVLPSSSACGACEADAVLATVQLGSLSDCLGATLNRSVAVDNCLYFIGADSGILDLNLALTTDDSDSYCKSC
ncbi:hypothetical protein B0H63DRAFT_554680 [Podospora didyma]|uniref:Uncharacterized protein n=1 Tax=Podospora didyma TaxID=330526 RepID=A0AAE0P4C4_9PEZI|nr:hypothetical protein B0H63DRAFT_554680 [Podospora didyma]